MINPAAMVGLENSAAYQQLGGINAALRQLYTLKEADTRDEFKQFKHEQEQDRRERQELKFVQEKEALEVIKYQKAMKTNEGGMLAALVAGATLLGAVTVLGNIQVKNFVGGVWDTIKEQIPWLKGDNTQADQEVDEASSTGDVSMLEGAEDGEDGGRVGKPLSKPGGIAVSSRPGMRGGRPHNGIDVAAPVGTPLTIKGNGKIVERGFDKGGYGKWIVIKDSRGEHLYAHLQKYGKYKDGQSVTTGDVVAYSGNTGRSSGPHLHWEFDPKAGVVGKKRSMGATAYPTKSGFSWDTPFTGKQTGGKVGSEYKSASDVISQSQPLGSLSPNVADLVAPGGVSTKTKQPYTKVTENTKIFPYKDPLGHPVMGFGSHMMGGRKVSMNSAPITKRQASGLMDTNLLKLQKQYENMIPNFSSLEPSTKTGLLVMGHNKPQAPMTNPRIKNAIQNRDKKELSAAVPTVVQPKYVQATRNLLSGKEYKPPLPRKGGSMNMAPPKQQRQGYQMGGVVSLGNMGEKSDIFNHYNAEFYTRQGKKNTTPTVIMVNNIVSGANTSVPGEQRSPQQSPPGPSNINYTDISQTFFRYMRGIKA